MLRIMFLVNETQIWFDLESSLDCAEMWWTCMITCGYLKMLWIDRFSLWLFAKVQVKFQAPNTLQVVIIKYNKIIN